MAKVQVYSFEPIPATFNYLTYNLRLNDVENVIPFNFGLAKNNQEALFYYFRGGSAIASLENLIEHENIDRISCKLRRMDDVVQEQKITKLDIIKCDVEGSELSILQGGLVTLEKLKPIIYIELYEPWCKKFDYNTSDVMSLLFGLGYKCYSAIQDRLINLTQIDNNNDKYNFFFLHTEKHKNILSKLLSN
ncbi:MAG TPA: FkbM family methyltransferase [Gammaproteobacteria bacterium]|nr:FkbM family methyltransferase [Gammaproteobacteria bacterium]